MRPDAPIISRINVPPRIFRDLAALWTMAQPSTGGQWGTADPGSMALHDLPAGKIRKHVRIGETPHKE
jgi:hypothetical protein